MKVSLSEKDVIGRVELLLKTYRDMVVTAAAALSSKSVADVEGNAGLFAGHSNAFTDLLQQLMREVLSTKPPPGFIKTIFAKSVVIDQATVIEALNTVGERSNYLYDNVMQELSTRWATRWTP